jgi:hypothetical protein
MKPSLSISCSQTWLTSSREFVEKEGEFSLVVPELLRSDYKD